MKPSERIYEIMRKGEEMTNVNDPSYRYSVSKTDALIQYLDEQWEKYQNKEEYDPYKPSILLKE